MMCSSPKPGVSGRRASAVAVWKTTSTPAVPERTPVQYQSGVSKAVLSRVARTGDAADGPGAACRLTEVRAASTRSRLARKVRGGSHDRKDSMWSAMAASWSTGSGPGSTVLPIVSSAGRASRPRAGSETARWHMHSSHSALCCREYGAIWRRGRETTRS